MMMLSQMLAAWRTSRKLTLRDVERRCGVSYVTIHRLEKGRTIMSTELARLLLWLLKSEKKP